MQNYVENENLYKSFNNLNTFPLTTFAFIMLINN